MRTALALVIVILVITPAAADIVLQSSPGTPLPAGNLVQYTVSAVGTAGEEIDTFSFPDISAVSGVGIHNVAQGITNAGTPTKSEHSPGLWNADWAAYDTYFLFNSTESLSFGPNFSETNNGATTGTLGLSTILGYTPTSGFGTYMSGVGSKMILPPNVDSDVPFMQVVLRAQDSAQLNVSMVGAVRYDRQIVIGPFVPEPSTWLLAAIGCVASLTRRREKSTR
jgi:hypothetical protein